MTLRMNQDPDMIARMELDLVTKVQAAYANAGLAPNVHGVFSLDDLEHKNEADLCLNIAIGVGYEGCTPVNVKAPGNVGSYNAARAVDFLYTIILAVPTGADCLERYSATKLLTVLRMGIMGSVVADDLTSRAWALVKETPNIQASTATMLYYSQLWRMEVIATGPQ